MPNNCTPRFQPAFVPATALAKLVEFDDAMMRVTLTDGRMLSVRLHWFPILREATPQRATYHICGGGVSLHWPNIDEDLSIAGLMAGVDRNAG